MGRKKRYDEEDDDDLDFGTGDALPGSGGKVGYDGESGYERHSGYKGVWRDSNQRYISTRGTIHDTPEAARDASASDVSMDSMGKLSLDDFVIAFFVTPAMMGPLVTLTGYLRNHWGVVISMWWVVFAAFFIASCLYFGFMRKAVFSFIVQDGEIRKRRKAVPFIIGIILLIPLIWWGGMAVMGADPLTKEIDVRWRNSLTDGRTAVVDGRDTMVVFGTGTDGRMLVGSRNAEKWRWVDSERVSIVRDYFYDKGAGDKAIAVPAKMIGKTIPVQRARRWKSRTIRTIDRDWTVIVTAPSRRGWTTVFAYDPTGKKNTKGYVNSGLLFVDDGSGAPMPTAPEGKRATVIGRTAVFSDLNARVAQIDHDPDYKIAYLPDDTEVTVLVGEDKKGWSLIWHDGSVKWMYFGNVMGVASASSEKSTKKSDAAPLKPVPPRYKKGTKITVRDQAQFSERMVAGRHDPMSAEGTVFYGGNEKTPKPKVGDVLTLVEDALPLYEHHGILPVRYGGKTGGVTNSGRALQGPVLATATADRNCRIYTGTNMALIGGAKTVAKLRKGDTVSVTGFSTMTQDAEVYTWVITADGKEGYILWDNLTLNE